MYFYSTKNIVACAAALAALGTAFAIGFPPLWPAIVAGAYGAGALAAPSSRAKVDLGTIGLNPNDIRRTLEKTLSAIQGKVPNDVFQAALKIHDGILSLLGHIGTLAPGSQERFIIQKMALDYLPTALQSYLSLPRGYANLHPITPGKTAKQVLLDQLDLLDKQLVQVTHAVLKGDTDRLVVANGRFLESRFGGDRSLSMERVD